jgi:hypothetical protein
MTAVYPAQVKEWVNRQNNVDDVDAGDINAAFAEITAVETALGQNPQKDPTLNGQMNDYGTVASRLATIQRGYDRPVVQVTRKTNAFYLANAVGAYMTWDPTTQVDPFNMFSSGTNIYVVRSGWYIATANANFGGSGVGQRVAAIAKNGVWIAGNTGVGWQMTQFGTMLNCGWQGKLNKGDIMQLWVWQNSGGTLVSWGDMELTFIREF